MIDPETLMHHELMEDWRKLREANQRKQMASAQDETFNVQSQPMSTRITLYLSLAGNVIISLAKFYAYSRTGHSAMFTEAIHTLVDVGNQAILGYGLREAERAPDKRYQYGLGGGGIGRAKHSQTK